MGKIKHCLGLYGIVLHLQLLTAAAWVLFMLRPPPFGAGILAGMIPVYIASQVVNTCANTSVPKTFSILSFCDIHACGACCLVQMAVEKLKQGIDGFAADQRKLEEMLAAKAGGK